MNVHARSPIRTRKLLAEGFCCRERQVPIPMELFSALGGLR